MVPFSHPRRSASRIFNQRNLLQYFHEKLHPYPYLQGDGDGVEEDDDDEAQLEEEDDEQSPGEIMPLSGEIELNADRKCVWLTVTSHCDRPIQIGSHYHFIETNPLLMFDRRQAYGMRLVRGYMRIRRILIKLFSIFDVFFFNYFFCRTLPLELRFDSNPGKRKRCH